MDTGTRLIRAVRSAARRLAASGTFDDLLNDVLHISVDAVMAFGGTIYLHEAESKRLSFRHVLPHEVEPRLPSRDIPDDFGLAGLTFQTRQTVIREFDPKPMEEQTSFEQATGVEVRTTIAVPLMMEDEEPIGVVQLINKKEGPFTENDQAILETVAAVSTMAFRNAQLAEEVARASGLLGMGKVSHDIGNLAATMHTTVGAGKFALDELQKQVDKKKGAADLQPYLEVAHEMQQELVVSVDRIVGYAQLISDLSAGRELRPHMHVGTLAETITSAAQFYEEVTEEHHIALKIDMQEDAPSTLHDQLYIFRIVQNLVGNAVKAVEDTLPEDWAERESNGSIEVKYRFDNQQHILEVKDSGQGMNRKTAERILSGTARSQWERASGSGWGTRIVLELSATHEALVEIDSKVGKGTTFRIRFPHRPNGE